ncbi:MAG TPA: hypothetical protein VKV27_11225 [Solirubrobacteraceae bacterium]|nr:hypothetical protein [Solirubrobacteraceae bacterium]
MLPLMLGTGLGIVLAIVFVAEVPTTWAMAGAAILLVLAVAGGLIWLARLLSDEQRPAQIVPVPMPQGPEPADGDARPTSSHRDRMAA